MNKETGHNELEIDDEALEAFRKVFYSQNRSNAAIDKQLRKMVGRPPSSTMHRHTARNYARQPHQFRPTIETPPFPTIAPIRFHVAISTTPSSVYPGAFNVISHPLAPDGREYKIKCGQIVVMSPNLIVPWRLRVVKHAGFTVTMYIAVNEHTKIIRHFYVHKDWIDEEDLNAMRMKRS